MNFKHIFLLMAIFVSSMSFAQQKKDPVEVVELKIDNISKQDIKGAGGQSLRLEVVLDGKEASDGRWVKNIEVVLTVAYKDVKAGSSKGKQFVFLKSTAKLYAIKVNQKTSAVFYIPWEAYDMYGLSGKPYAWKISLSAGGAIIPLSASNKRTMISSTISSQKGLEEFEKLVSENADTNDGFMRPLNACDANILFYELEKRSGGSSSIPTYLPIK